jgi:hypothetical protein
MNLLINVDVPDLAAAIAIYTAAFGLILTRRFGADGAELDGGPRVTISCKSQEGRWARR